MEFGERSESYYNILGVAADSSIDEVRRAYRKLAMQWHPDKWATANPSLHCEAKRKFQKIQEAYSVLSDPGKRSTYDIGMYDPNEEDDEGFCDFVDEMLNLMSQVKEEEKAYSLGDLQNMFNELAQSFTPPPADWDAGPVPSVSHPTAAFQGRLRWETNPIQSRVNPMPASGFGVAGIDGCCR